MDKNEISSSWYYSDIAVGGTSDKEYHLQIERVAPGKYNVNYQHGRRGGTLQGGTKASCVSIEEATAVYNDEVNVRRSKGYTESGAAKAAPVAANGVARTKFPVELLEEITETEAKRLINDPRYWMQLKANGHRREIEKTPDGQITSYNRKGEAVGLLSEIVAALKQGAIGHYESFLLDGELVGDNFVVFDLLSLEGDDKVAQYPYKERFELISDILKTKSRKPLTVVPTWRRGMDKEKAMKEIRKQRGEGVVFKLSTAKYRAGRNGQHRKFKFTKTCSAFVTAVAANGKASIDVAVVDFQQPAGRRKTSVMVTIPVGSCSTIGRPVPKPGDVVEVRYLYATKAKHLYQPVYLAIRNDQCIADCTVSQLIYGQGEEA